MSNEEMVIGIVEKKKCNAILLTEDDGDVQCQSYLDNRGYCFGGHRHVTPEGVEYRW